MHKKTGLLTAIIIFVSFPAASAVRDALRIGADLTNPPFQYRDKCQQRVKSDPLTVTTNGLILIHLVYSGLASAITPAFRFCFSR